MTTSPTSAVAPYPRSKYDGVRMSLAEYEALPEEKPYLEYWDGIVVQKAVPKLDHRRIAEEVVVEIRSYRRSHGGDSGPEAHVWFRDHGWLVPDVVYWAPSKPVGDMDRQLPPTLAVEIRSKGQQLSRLETKCRNMRANGVDVCWLIDPQRRVAYVFEGDLDGERLATTGVLESPHLPGFSLPLPQLWAELDR